MKSYDLDTISKTLTLVFGGDILSTNSEEIRSKVFQLLESDQMRNASWSILKLDLLAAKMIDSTGLNLIIAIIKAAKSRGGSVKSVISSTNIHRTFLFTRLDAQMEISVVNAG